MTADLYLVDTHAHLNAKEFDDDRLDVIHRAQEAGIRGIITVSETLEDIRRNIALEAEYPCLKTAGGLYPEYADMNEAAAVIDFIRNQPENFHAVGEVGLDFWIAQDDAAKELQRQVFKQFILLARELDLPVNVHSRSAGRQAVALLLEHNAVRVQMHAFDGKYSSALPAIEAGYFFSIPPSIVRSRQKQKLVQHLPLTSLLVESDSPVLGPDPSQRNEPVYILTAVQAISEIKAIAYQEVLENICENTRKLYVNL